MCRDGARVERSMSQFPEPSLQARPIRRLWCKHSLSLLPCASWVNIINILLLTPSIVYLLCLLQMTVMFPSLYFPLPYQNCHLWHRAGHISPAEAHLKAGNIRPYLTTHFPSAPLNRSYHEVYTGWPYCFFSVMLNSPKQSRRSAASPVARMVIGPEQWAEVSASWKK